MSINIDELSVKITSDADKATGGVDGLVSSLESLKGAVNGVQKLSTTAKQIEAIATAVNKIGSGTGAKIKELANGLKALSSVGNIGNISTSLNRVAEAVNKFQTTDTSAITKLGNSLQSLSTLSLPNLSSVGTGLKNITTAVNSLGTVSDSKLEQTANAIEKIAEASKSFSGVSNNAFSSVARTLNSIPKITSNLNDENVEAFANACKRVSDAVKPLTSELNSVSPAVATLMLRLTSASNVEDSAKRATNLLEDAVASLKAELIALVPGFGTVLSVAKTVTETFQKIVRGIKSVINAIKNVWNVIKNVFNKIKEILGKIGSVIGKIGSAFYNSFAGVAKAAGRVISSIFEKVTTLFGGVKNNGLIGNFTDLYNYAKAFYSSLTNITTTLYNLTKSSGDYEEMMNMYAVAMGNAAEAGVEYANVVQDAVGINAADWMENEAIFMNIVHGYGVASDRAATISQQLTQIGYDLSSIWNEDVATAMEKLQSGIAGEIEPLRRWGVDLSQTRLEQEALTLGINESVSSMTQAEKAQLRYIAIFNQVSEQGVLGDMAKTINSSANQMRVFAAQIELVGRSIGNVFIPIINQVLPYIIALAKAVRSVVDSIAGFFGYTLPTVGDFSVGSIGDTIGDLTDDTQDLADATGSAAESAEDYKNTILGIDELNVLNDTTTSGSGGSGGSSGGSGGGSGSGWDFDIPTYNFLEKLLDQGTDNILKNLTKLDEFNWVGLRTKIHTAMTKIAKSFNKVIEEVPWETIGNFGAEAFNTFNQALNTFWYETNKLGSDGLTTWQRLGRGVSKGVKQFVSAVDWTAVGMQFKYKMHSVLDMLSEAVTEFSKKGANGINGFEAVGVAIANYLEAAFSYDKQGKSIFKKAAVALSTTIKGIATSTYTAITELNNSLDKNGRNWFQKTGESLGEALASVFSDKELFSKATKSLTSLIGDENKGVLGGISSAVNAMAKKDSITGLSSWEALGQNVASGVESIFSATNFKAAASALSTAFKGVLSAFKTTLAELNSANYFRSVGSTIADMLVGAFSEGGLFNEASKAIGEALTSSLQLLDGSIASMNAVDYSSGLNGWQQFGRGIANAFNNIFTDENVNSIIGSLDGMATGIVTALEESLGNKEVHTKITSIATSLAKSFAKVISSDEVQEMIGNALRSLAQTMSQIITSDEVQGVLKTAWSSILDSLEAVLRENHPMLEWVYKVSEGASQNFTIVTATGKYLWDSVTGSGDTTQGTANTYVPYTTKEAQTADAMSWLAKSAESQEGLTKVIENSYKKQAWNPLSADYNPFAVGTNFTTKKTSTTTTSTNTNSIASTSGTLSLRAEIAPGTGMLAVQKIKSLFKKNPVDITTNNTDATSTGRVIYNNVQKTASKNTVKLTSEDNTKPKSFLESLQDKINAYKTPVSIGAKSNGDAHSFVNSLQDHINATNRADYIPRVGAKSNGDGYGFINSLQGYITTANNRGFKPGVGAKSNGDGRDFINSLQGYVTAENDKGYKPRVGAKSNGDGQGYINSLQSDVNGYKVDIAANVTGLSKSIQDELSSHLAKFTITSKSGTIVDYGAASLNLHWDANGGFEKAGQMFIAREAGPELVGTIGRRTAVVNNEQIVASVARGVESANAEEAALLREQNKLLRAILAKDSTVTVSTSQIVNGLNRASRRTGTVSV